MLDKKSNTYDLREPRSLFSPLLFGCGFCGVAPDVLCIVHKPKSALQYAEDRGMQIEGEDDGAHRTVTTVEIARRRARMHWGYAKRWEELQDQPPWIHPLTKRRDVSSTLDKALRYPAKGIKVL